MARFNFLLKRRGLVGIVVLTLVPEVVFAAEPQRDPLRTFWKAANGGVFTQATDGKWTQMAASGYRYNYVTAAVTKDYLELRDDSRNLSLRLYNDKAEMSVADADFKPLLKGTWGDPSKAPTAKADSSPASVANATTAHPDHRVRLIYFVPKDRQPISGYQDKIRTVMAIVDSVYLSELRRRRWKSGGLQYELDKKDLPVVHLVRGQNSANFYNGAPNYDTHQQWRTFIPEIPKEIGAPSRNLIVGFLETYDEAPAAFEWPGGVALGAPFSADGGLGIFSAWILKDEFAAANEAAQLRLFQDQTPILGRTALGNGRINSPRFEFIEDGIGAVIHEVGHALGLPHDHRESSSIMGNGFRQLRNNFVPSFSFQGKATFSNECALLLNSSRHLNPALDMTDASPPEVTVTVRPGPSGPVSLKIDAADNAGLRAVAVFDVVEDSIVTGQAISGTKWSKTVRIPFKRNAQGAVQLRVLVADNGGHITVTRHP